MLYIIDKTAKGSQLGVQRCSSRARRRISGLRARCDFHSLTKVKYPLYTDRSLRARGILGTSGHCKRTLCDDKVDDLSLTARQHKCLRQNESLRGCRIVSGYWFAHDQLNHVVRVAEVLENDPRMPGRELLPRELAREHGNALAARVVCSCNRGSMQYISWQLALCESCPSGLSEPKSPCSKRRPEAGRLVPLFR